MKEKTIYISKDGDEFTSKSKALRSDKAYDKEQKIISKQRWCKHDFREKQIEGRKDVGHHDWVEYVYTVKTCRKCKYIVDDEDDVRHNTY